MEPGTNNPNDIEAMQRQIAELQAQLAAKQTQDSENITRGGDELGERSAKVGGANSGTINTGTQIVNNYHAKDNARLSKEQIAQRIGGYLAWLCEQTKDITLRGIEGENRAPVVILPLEKVYVPLRAKAMPRLGEEQGKLHGKRGTEDTFLQHETETDKQEADIELNQVLGLGNRLVIIGGPGSGKTTVLLHMAWALASSLLAGNAEMAHSRLGLTLEPDALPLPIFVPLASFARHRRNPAYTEAHQKTLLHYISHHLIAKQTNINLPADFFVQLLNDGRNVLLLLDGLDEVANEHERAEVRQSVEELVSGHPEMRVAVTCRPIAYRNGNTALGADFREIAVQPLDAEQHVAPMVQQAYACIYPNDSTQRDERSNDLLNSIRRLEHERRARTGKDAKALVDSPLMVRLLLIVHMNNRTLPDERATLFDMAIKALLQVEYGREQHDIKELATIPEYRDMAQHLAFHMQRQGTDQGREIDESSLIKALREEADFSPHIDYFLEQARQRGSLLEERNRTYRYTHLAFQEFLAARYLREVIGISEGSQAILDTLEGKRYNTDFINVPLVDSWWREPILLLAGYMTTFTAKPASEFISKLAKAGTTPDMHFSAAELAGTAALEWRGSSDTLRAECARRIVTLLEDTDALLASKPVLRARAGNVLARLGDPRFDTQRFYLPADDMLGFVHIPADPKFRIGTRKADSPKVKAATGYDADKDEINDELTTTPEFYIAQYPVTVAQFRAYAEATGSQSQYENALSAPNSRPVTEIDWSDARKYCVWLNEQLGNGSGEIAELVRNGWRIDLPSELEWEKAARGEMSDRVFSWGNEPDVNRANYDDTGIGATSAVGCFPANDFGLYDMLGNVWEWTRSPWQDSYAQYDFNAEEVEGEANKVVRGGSWVLPRDSSRCACRGRLHPDLRNVSLGFRVVLRSAPVK